MEPSHYNYAKYDSHRVVLPNRLNEETPNACVTDEKKIEIQVKISELSLDKKMDKKIKYKKRKKKKKQEQKTPPTGGGGIH